MARKERSFGLGATRVTAAPPEGLQLNSGNVRLRGTMCLQ